MYTLLLYFKYNMFSISYCLACLIEQLSAFGNEADLEMRGKVLKRLNAITELQHTLNVCLRRKLK